MSSLLSNDESVSDYSNVSKESNGNDEFGYPNLVKKQKSEVDSDDVDHLRNLCIQKGYPLPEFEFIQKRGNFGGLEFCVQCQIGSVSRTSIGITKKLAKQNVAKTMIHIIESLIPQDEAPEVSSISEITEAIEKMDVDNNAIFKTYKYLKKNDLVTAYTGKKFALRHLYFKKMPNELRTKGFQVLNNDSYPEIKDKVVDLMNALKLDYKITNITMRDLQTFLVFEVLCDIDVIFITKKDSIFKEVLEYFEEML